MKVISHRGYWKAPAEKNTAVAFERSFALGFGTETDVRDRDGELVISHDMASRDAMPLGGFTALAAQTAEPLAINLKADGLAAPLAAHFAGLGLDWFAFDMSVPDMRTHLDAGNPVFGRMSEVEPVPPWLGELSGIWLDAFRSDWFDCATVQRLLERGLRVCIVSPELHRRPRQAMWQMLLPLAGHSRVILCTDFPQEAQTYFCQV